ncbi:MAG: ATP-binding cassette domain-containing protein [Chloroflexi bacterium]|nr:ATP-binding cassette domain-containing protein [Chloroflexota bacterium]
MEIELRHIHKYFGPVHANDDITLTIPSGSIQGLLGENGAGKSTLMKILSGYLRPDAGEIRINGSPIEMHSPADAIRFGIGMLHQDPMDFPPMRVLDNFMVGYPEGLLLPREEARQALLDLSAQFGFSLDPDAYVESLTVGERQQLEIVRLLWLGAQVLIFDEPTTGISAQQKEKLFAALHRLADEGKTIIFVTHKLEEVEILCDQVAVLRAGKLVGEAKPPYDLDALVEMMFGKVVTKGERVSAPLGKPVLQLKNLAVESHRIRIAGVNLEVREGEVIGLAGMEGSGQRQLLRACAGLIRPVEGEIWVDGHNLTGKPYHDFMRHGVAYVPAARLEEGLVPNLTLLEHMILADEQRGLIIDRQAALDLTKERIKTFNIRGRPHSTIESLSGGNQQRALLALLRPGLRLLLMEHPTRGLDMESAIWVWQTLKRRCREEKTAIFFMSSDLEEILHYSDRILVFFSGQVSEPIPATETDIEQLGQLIGGRGFNTPEEATP